MEKGDFNSSVGEYVIMDYCQQKAELSQLFLNKVAILGPWLLQQCTIFLKNGKD